MPSYAYFKKQIIPLEEAKMGVMTHAFHYGTGGFGGIRGNWNKSKEQLYLFRLKEHFERMLDGCHALRINLPYSLSELSQITVDMVRKCAFREDIYVRPVAYKSSEALGVRLHGLEDDFLVFAFPWGPYLDVETAKCAVSSWRRPKETPQGKITGLYVSAALAKSEAVGNGFDEAIMLTPDGFVAEGSGENIKVTRPEDLVIGEAILASRITESGTRKTDDGSRFEVRGFRNFEPRASNFESCLSRSRAPLHHCITNPRE